VNPTRAQVGRPRSAEADEAIRNATIAEFAERGYDGMRIGAVAERAGVAKTTLYRRFPGKADLVQHALSTQSDEVACPHSDSLEDDLFRLVVRLRDKFTSDTLGRAIPALLDAAARHDDLRGIHRRFMAERRASGLARIGAAIDNGELPGDADAEMMLDQLSATVFFRSFVWQGDLGEEELRELVARVLAGAKAHPRAVRSR
jgi:AcrR family transcriptional regulator